VLAGADLKTIKDITGYVVFPEGTKSLLSKFLTRDVFTKYYGKKDKCGVSFQ